LPRRPKPSLGGPRHPEGCKLVCMDRNPAVMVRIRRGFPLLSAGTWYRPEGCSYRPLKRNQPPLQGAGNSAQCSAFASAGFLCLTPHSACSRNPLRQHRSQHSPTFVSNATGRDRSGVPTNASMASTTSALRCAVPVLTAQELPSALSVPTTLAERPLSARARFRTLRLALRDEGGRAGTGSVIPSITLAVAPASRSASMPLISSIDRSICSSVMALTPPECSSFISRGTSKTRSFRNTAGWFRITFLSPCGRRDGRQDASRGWCLR